MPFRVTLDGEPPGAAHGSDVDADGSGVLTYPRMDQLIRQEGPIGDRRFEIEFLERRRAGVLFHVRLIRRHVPPDGAKNIRVGRRVRPPAVLGCRRAMRDMRTREPGRGEVL